MSEKQRMAELLRDVHEYIGTSIPHTVSEHYRGCDLLDRIDAVLAGQVPDHFADVSKMVAPEGWQLVPVEPTFAMLAADGCKEHHEGQECTFHKNRRRIWAAMLAAAPKHQGGEPCDSASPSSSPD